jgi:hypothetical protein
VWKARCPPLADRTVSGWLQTKTSLSSPKPTFKIRNTHTCFCRPRLLEQAALGSDLTTININSPLAGIIPRHQRNPCGAPLRAWKIPRMAGRLMCSRLIPAARTASLAPYTRRQLSPPEYRRTCEWRDSRSCRLPGNRLINNLIPLATARGRPGSIDVARQRQMEMACPQAALWTSEGGCFPFSQFLESEPINRTKGIAHAFFNLSCN